MRRIGVVVVLVLGLVLGSFAAEARLLKCNASLSNADSVTSVGRPA